MTAAFSENNSAELVAERLTKQTGGPLADFLVAAVAHLHSVVRETRPTAADWRRAIEFLTEVINDE